MQESLILSPYSLLPTPYSLLPTPYSLLPTPYSLFSVEVYSNGRRSVGMLFRQ
ncbi:MAG: hypothetical protein WBA93_23615 [Microcoleaceae cyanobacterium]